MAPRRLDRAELHRRLSDHPAWAIDELADMVEGAALSALAKADERRRKKPKPRKRRPDREVAEETS